MLVSVVEFIGRFHPVLVHLPIGILLIALLLQLLSFNKKYIVPDNVLKMVWGLGALSAFFSCITGYLLFISGEYEEPLVNIHLWMGIAMALVSGYAVLKVFLHQFDKGLKIICVLLILLITTTGHYGGSLTHGGDYLTSALHEEENTTAIKPVPDIQNAYIYADVVEPLLNAKCYSCHGPKRKKGKLRMDNAEYLLKGGEDGKILLPGNADSSELIRRLLLPLGHKEHMPPKQKSQLAEEHIALLQWWVATGASFDKKVNALAQTEQIKPVLAVLEKGIQNQVKESIIPETPVEPGDAKTIELLRERGVVIIPVAQDINYLSANFVIAKDISIEDLQLLAPLKKQLIWLKMNNAKIGDNALKIISQCSNLQVLQLGGTGITDKGIAALQELKNLRALNITNTAITSDGLLLLKNLPQLRHVYLYKTHISQPEWPALMTAFPGAKLDTGGYIVPTFSSDTTNVVPK